VVLNDHLSERCHGGRPRSVLFCEGSVRHFARSRDSVLRCQNLAERVRRQRVIAEDYCTRARWSTSPWRGRVSRWSWHV